MSGYEELLRNLTAGPVDDGDVSAEIEAAVPAAHLDRLVDLSQPFTLAQLAARSVVLLKRTDDGPVAVSLVECVPSVADGAVTKLTPKAVAEAVGYDARARICLDAPMKLWTAQRRDDACRVVVDAARLCAVLDPRDWPPQRVEAIAGLVQARGVEDTAREVYLYALMRLRRRWGQLAGLLLRWPIELVDWASTASAHAPRVALGPLWLTERRVLLDPLHVLVTPPELFDRAVFAAAFSVWHDAPGRLGALGGVAVIGGRPVEPDAVAVATSAQAWLWAQAATNAPAEPLWWAVATDLVSVDELDDDEREAVSLDPDLVTVTGDPPTQLVDYLVFGAGPLPSLADGLTWRSPWPEVYQTIYDRLPKAPPTPGGGQDQRDDQSTSTRGSGGGSGDGGSDGGAGGGPNDSGSDGGAGGGPNDSGSDGGADSGSGGGGGGPSYRDLVPDRVAQQRFGLGAPTGDDPRPTDHDRARVTGELAGKLAGTDVGAALRDLAAAAEPREPSIVSALIAWADRRVARASADDVSWHRPSAAILRRHGVWWPARAQPSMGPITIIIDVSASMTPQQLATACDAVQAVCARLLPEYVRVLAADCAAVEVALLDRMSVTDIVAQAQTWLDAAGVTEVRGGGGTHMGRAITAAVDPSALPSPAAEAMGIELQRPELVIVLTDCYTPWCADPGVPVVVGRVDDNGPPPPDWAHLVEVR